MALRRSREQYNLIIFDQSHKPSAPLEYLTPFRGNVTKVLNVVVSAPALLLTDVGSRSCDGVLAGFAGYPELGDRCWRPTWSRRLVLLIRCSVFAVGVLLMAWPEIQMFCNSLVRKFIVVDAWNRLRFRMSVSWGLLFFVYLLSATASHQPVSLLEPIVDTLQSWTGYMGFACVVSYLSTRFRWATHQAIYNVDVPEDLECHGQWTAGLMVVYRLALQIDGHWRSSATPMILCHIFLDFDCTELFRRIIRPIIRNNDRRADQDCRRRAVTGSYLILSWGILSFFALLLTSRNASVHSALWFTMPVWLLFPWMMRIAGEYLTIRHANLTRYRLWNVESELSEVAPIIGQLLHAAVCIPMFGLIIYIFYGHRPIAWMLWAFFVASINQMIYDGKKAYKLMAPRRVVYKWISSKMSKPRSNDPRLVNDCCAICFGSPRGADDVRLTACNHMYHIACLGLWLFDQHTCPTCRRPLRVAGPFPADMN